MMSSYPLWWLALPALLLPIWWHRQKRQRIKAEPLATARFLPLAAPEQLRIWRWRDRILLLVRCALLAAAIGWLAATIFPWRGDTVLLDESADHAWAEKQIASAGLNAAQRIALPPDALRWLRQHERDWRPDARLLIVAATGHMPMPARLPQFNHQLELRVQPQATGAAEPSAAKAAHHVTLAVPPARSAAWQSLFSALERAGDGASHYVVSTEPEATTELIVWDIPNTAPPSNWHAPQWWIAAGSVKDAQAAFLELAHASTLTINGLTLKYADSPRGRLWFADVWPPRDADGARAIYEAMQALRAAPAPAYTVPAQTFAAARGALTQITDARPADWLGYALLALFLLERILTHARRH